MTGWQPIETAPKDGNHVIAFWPGYKRPCIMWWNKADQAFESESDRNEAPTHWMPLPHPPSVVDPQRDQEGG